MMSHVRNFVFTTIRAEIAARLARKEAAAAPTKVFPLVAIVDGKPVVSLREGVSIVYPYAPESPRVFDFPKL